MRERRREVVPVWVRIMKVRFRVVGVLLIRVVRAGVELEVTVRLGVDNVTF